MNLDKFSKIAMLMTSPEREERLTAVKMANSFLEKNGMTWADLILTKEEGSSYKRRSRSAKPRAQADRLLNNAHIISETEKAYLIEVSLQNGEEIEVWFPKSQMEQRDNCVFISSWIETMKNKELREQGHDSELSVANEY